MYMEIVKPPSKLVFFFWQKSFSLMYLTLNFIGYRKSDFTTVYGKECTIATMVLISLSKFFARCDVSHLCIFQSGCT